MTPFMKGPLRPLGTHTKIQFMNRGTDMMPFMKCPLRPRETHTMIQFMNRGADMTPFMKGPLGPPWNTNDDPIYESGR